MNRQCWGFINFLFVVTFPTVITEKKMPRVRLVTGGRLLGIVVLLAFWLMPAAYAQSAGQVSASIVNGNVTITGARGPAFHPGHTLVRFRPGAAADFLPGSGPKVPFPALPGLFLVNNPPGLSVAGAVRRYHANPNVLYAEPDFYVQAVTTTPTDPLWSQQYDMVKIAAPTAWDTQTNAADVIVAIIDTGIDFTHPDLQANIWTDPGNSTTHGFTCMNGTCTVGGSDDFGHGTHVAGTIGASANNGIGIAGINWQVQLLSVKFLNSSGSGLISDATLSFNKVLTLIQQGFKIRMTSNSWGGGGFSQSLKDAMSQVEAAGAVNVCAAGNSGQNADASPMYPAAYDNRGIISVLASDQNDVGAGFTNYGLASVDIAAPGVSTLSTVPTTSCTLCDPSGYKLLSGTSMATPHVSGVLAAMFHKNPALTANQARDVVLDPASYDALSDTRASTTSTGGRLNFAKSIANPLLFSPKLNNFPVLSMGPNVFVAAGGQVTLTASATDADSDPLRMGWTKSTDASSAWLFGFTLNSLFPSPTGNPFSFTAPSPARTAMMAYDASVADGRGGGAHGRDSVTVSPSANPGQPPSGTLTVSPADAPAGSTINVSFPATDPEGGPVSWDFWIGQQNGASGSCCYSGSSTSVTLNNPGVYRFSTQAIDRELNLSARQSAVVRIGGATGTPPIAGAVLDKVSGTVPLTVNIDMSASNDPDGTIISYFMNCGGGTFTPGSPSSHGSCSFSTPGTYWLLLEAEDNSFNFDILSAYVVVTPPTSTDTTPPSVSMTSPAPGATVSGVITVSASASDLESGVQKVDFYRDSPGVFIGTATASPYNISWDTSTVAAGTHTLYAVATDNAGNSATSAPVSITVAGPPPPVVSITNPANNSTVTRRSTVTITASVTASNNPISRVDFLVNSSVVCSITSSTTYTCNWPVPAAANKSYGIQAKAFDTAGKEGDSSIVTVIAN